MSDSRKGIDFFPEPKPAVERQEAELKNSSLPIDTERTTDTTPEQSPCTQKVGIRRTYDAIQKDVENGLSGEVIRRKYGFKRTKDLLDFLYMASMGFDKPQIPIRFETNFGEGEKPLHPLKIGSDGSLRISAMQLKRRAKIDAPEGTEFIIKPLENSDGEEGFILTKVKNPFKAY